MTRLIDDLLNLSRISRQEMQRLQIDITGLAHSIVSELREADPGRTVEVTIADGLTAFADRRLAEIVLSNLLGNAWKFTSKTKKARIEFGVVENPPGEFTAEGDSFIGISPSGTVFFVKDNGAGFDPDHSEKMFRPFHRLHSDREFDGTGIGLTIVDRIIRRHGGRITAQGRVGEGTTIYFTLG
jgi:signal transduction histidine kinase